MSVSCLRVRTMLGRRGVRGATCVTLLTLLALTGQSSQYCNAKYRCVPSVNYNRVPIKEKTLCQPPLQEIAEVLSRGLTSTFETVEVSVVHCPDLTKSPYNLTSPGLTGNAKLVELGGTPYLMPVLRRDKVYDLAALARHLRRDPAVFIGAGTGTWPYLGFNSEGVINLSIRCGVVDQGTRLVYVTPRGAPKGKSHYAQQRLPDCETRVAVMGNYLLSDGRPGKVIKVVAKKRIGPSNFITAIRETLKSFYGDEVIGLGGTFMLRAGKATLHVMPDFSRVPLRSDAEVDAWLHFFEMPAPITHVGTIITGDLGLDLRLQHFHGFSSHDAGGHYYNDTTPDEVEYEGYFTLASSIIRVDAPAVTNNIGRT